MKPKDKTLINHPDLNLVVLGRNGLTINASIRPVEITMRYARGVVQWVGYDHPSSNVGTEGEETAWGQRLALVVAATSPDCAPNVPVFRTGEWSSAVLTLPDLLGEPGDVVRVTVNSHDCKAQLDVTNQPELRTEQDIPSALQNSDVATTAVEMLARMFLGRSWLTLELMPQ
jgi:hypothetical protein